MPIKLIQRVIGLGIAWYTLGYPWLIQDDPAVPQRVLRMIWGVCRLFNRKYLDI